MPSYTCLYDPRSLVTPYALLHVLYGTVEEAQIRSATEAQSNGLLNRIRIPKRSSQRRVLDNLDQWEQIYHRI